MLVRAAEWIRLHPFRTAVYALLVGVAVFGALTVRGILRGERDGLITRVAQAEWLRALAVRDFQIRYSVQSVGFRQECGGHALARGIDVELIGAARFQIAGLDACANGKGSVSGVSLAPEIVKVDAAVWDWPQSISVRNAGWRDQAGDIVRLKSVQASPGSLSGSAAGLQIAGIAAIQSVSAALEQPPSSTVAVRSVDVHRVEDVVADAEALTPATRRVEAAAAVLSDILSKVIARVMDLAARWVPVARRYLLLGILVAAAVLLVAKLLLTRSPVPWVWRIAAILAPFVAFPLLARTNSWVAVAIAAVALPIVLWAVAYRRSKKWHQRWEPAVVDAAGVVLALPLMLMWSLRAIPVASLPAIDRISVAEVNVNGVSAVVRQKQCGPGDLARVSVGQAGASSILVALAGADVRSVKVGRAFASGVIDTQAIAAIQPIQFIPAEWKRAPSTPFCVTVAAHDGGSRELPLAVCSAATVNVQAAVDYTNRSATFAADWRGSNGRVAVRGAGDLAGARVHSVNATGARLRIESGAGTVRWTGPISAKFDVRGVRAGDASISTVGAEATLPSACASGAVRVNGRAGGFRYAASGEEIRLLDADFDFARPNAGSLSANATLKGLAVDGRIATSIDTTQVRFDADTSTQPVPSRLEGRVRVVAGAIHLPEPLLFSADLWNGTLKLPKQRVGVVQNVSGRIPRDLGIDLEASAALASIASPFQANAAVSGHLADLSPVIGPLDLRLSGLRFDTSWTSRDGLGPVRLGTGWNVLTIGDLPDGFTLDEVTRLHVAAKGSASGVPEILDVLPAFPTLPRELRFRVEGTPQSITLFPENGTPILIDGIDTSIRGSFPDLKFGSLDAAASARVRRAANVFPVALEARLTESGAQAEVSQPLGLTIAATDQTATFTLSRPLDTGKLLNDVGIEIAGLDPQARIASLKGQTTFGGSRLTGLEVAGTLAAGPLVKGKSFEVAQAADATFSFSAPVYPKAMVSVEAPEVRLKLDGEKLATSLAVSAIAKVALAPSPTLPVFDRIVEAADALRVHIDKGTDVFGEASASNYPVAWDVEVNGDGQVVSVKQEKLSLRAKTAIRRFEIRQETFDGALDVSADATLSDGALLLNLIAPGSVGILGRRFDVNSPLALSLRKQLAPDSGGPLFDRKEHTQDGDGPIRVAIGYGDALQFATSFKIPLYTARAEALAQAQIKWKPGAAAIDSFGTFSFQGLEAGRIAYPNPALEDRFNGTVEFRTNAFEIGRLFLPQLLSDASRVDSIDRATVSVQLASSGDNGGLPGITQSSTGLSFEPADQLLRIITQALDLKFPPRALFYKSLALDFRVKDGIVDTAPVLLTLRGVDAPGVSGLLDSDIRVHWSRRRGEPAPRLRDLIYTVQRAIEP